MSTSRLVEHYFRHEYGRLVAMLARRVGVEHLEAVEDAVQAALMTALETWTKAGLPDNPAAWLYAVARRGLTAELRQGSRRRRLLAESMEREAEHVEVVQDDLLRMLFVCCDEAIPEESQLVLALKLLCGFDVREIALRLFSTEAHVYKRLSRGRRRLRELPSDFGELAPRQRARRVRGVLKVLYLLFTEGHLSYQNDAAIRQELCDEALRLATLLAEHPIGQVTETYALLALMHLQLSRMKARRDASGGLLLLEEQDRTLWDQEQIQTGLAWLARSAEGEHFSRYHAEAGVAAEHCLARTFEETRWDRVVECYELLERIEPSAIHRLNRAIALAEWQGPRAGLALLEGFTPPTWLTGSYLWSAVLADLHRRVGNRTAAQRYRELALEAAPTPAVKELLGRRLRAS